jgi:hypothetical protein
MGENDKWKQKKRRARNETTILRAGVLFFTDSLFSLGRLNQSGNGKL